MTTYTYLRTGNGHVHGPYNGMTKRQALQLVGETLCDNGYAVKADAQRFAATVKLDGTPATFGPYTFTLTKDAR